MSSLNQAPRTRMSQNAHGTIVPTEDAEKQLMRMTLANMLWEGQFYTNGQEAAKVMAGLVKRANPDFVSKLALAARDKFNLRHVPLLLARELARAGKLKADTLSSVIQRPDEMGEFLSIYWKEGRKPLANQVKKGLAASFAKFSEYALAKWDKNNAAISLRDVMFMVHPKPADSAQADLFKKIADQKLETPDTWETQLSAGADKKETFERLMAERKLGALAFLRNLRNMNQAGVSDLMIESYSHTVNVDKVLPFRYIAAARIVPQYKTMLEQMMFRSLASHEKLPGKTKLLIDVSGSMFGTSISAKSDLDRFDAAAALAILAREICESVEIYSFSDNAVRVRDARGFALVDAISNSQRHGHTYLGMSLHTIRGNADRVIVFTDEQSSDRPKSPRELGFGTGYIVNVAAYQNGVNHADWLTVSGFSEAIIDYIMAVEKNVTIL